MTELPADFPLSAFVALSIMAVMCLIFGIGALISDFVSERMWLDDDEAVPGLDDLED